jgi:predicted nucleic acid-binding protein
VTTRTPERIFLETNVLIIGSAYPDSHEADILRWAGFGQTEPGPVEVIVSEELFQEIRRVARRLRHKDWAGELLGHIWQDFRLRYVMIDSKDLDALMGSGAIPSEDTGVFLTARVGLAQCFVSANHELITTIAQRTGEFECLTPAEFVEKYLQL